MGKFYGGKRAIWKRTVSALLAAALFVSVMQGYDGIAAYAAPESTPTVYGGSVLRGVVDAIAELPHYGEDNPYKDSERGTVHHPFTILEIVGYEEQAEIGYLVGGCEPIKLKELQGYSETFMINDVFGQLGTCEIVPTTYTDNDSALGTFFFSDEMEGDYQFYKDVKLVDSDWADRKVDKSESEKSVTGYWERVADNEGKFTLTKDGATNTVYMKSDYVNGDFIWHTVNNVELGEFVGISFNDVLNLAENYSVGTRIYTTRSNADLSGGQLYNVGGLYNYYKNNEILLKEAMGLSEKEAANYSVVVKTITTTELNANPEWVDYADLIYISPVSENAEIAKWWKMTGYDNKPVNRLGHKSAATTYLKNIFETKDLDFSVVERIFYKVTAEEDFAALMMDRDLYNLNSKYYTYGGASGSIMKDVTMDVYDWNLDRLTNPNAAAGVSELSLMSLFEAVSNQPGFLTGSQLSFTAEDMIHNFTESGTTSSFYTISGNLSTSKGTVTYNGLTLTQCLKMESATSISFTASNAGSLTLVFNENFSGAVKIDGTSYALTDAGVFTVNLSAGAHTITKGDTSNLYYVSFVEGAAPEETATPTPSATPTPTPTPTPEITPTPTPTPTATPTVKPTASSTPGTSAGTQIHNFTLNDTNSSFYTITGNLSTSYGTVVYNNIELTQCLKMESSTSIKFNPLENGVLTLIFNSSSEGASIIIEDGSGSSTHKITDIIMKFNVEGGKTYTIKKGSSKSFLYYMSVVYGEGGVVTPTPTPSATPTVKPTAEPSEEPTPTPTQKPEATARPTDAPQAGDSDGTNYTVKDAASRNNIYKLALMTVSTNPNLVKQIWFKNGYISGDGKNLLQSSSKHGDVFWNGYTFKLGRQDMDTGYNLYADWNSEESWSNYGWSTNLGTAHLNAYVKGHIFTFTSNNGIAKYFGSFGGTVNAPVSYYPEFTEYMKEQYNSTRNSENAKPSDALRYILDLEAEEGLSQDVLQVLDIEPAVSLDKNSKQDWELTESYVYMLVPDFTGDVEIVHQTTAEFNGKTEDLNSEYDLIYIGTDYSAYNTTKEKQDVVLQDGTRLKMVLTDFSDSKLDGKIYFHMGDSMTSTEYIKWGKDYVRRTRSVQFLYSVSQGKAISGTELRFPGNDITKLKMAELEEYLASGCPIVADKFLYNLEPKLIGSDTNLWSFISANKHATGTANKVFAINDASGINECVEQNNISIVFNELPPIYNGETVNGNSAVIKNPNYLPRNSRTNRAYLKFGFTVGQKNYGYRIYVDQNRDGKFENSEVIVNGRANKGYNTYTYSLALSMVGLVQWKLEIYNRDNESVHRVESGCSAVEVKSDSDKKTIRVLQILPNSGDYGDNALLDLETSRLFKKYMNNLNDFEITIHSIVLEDFEEYFEVNGGETKFSFDMSKPISSTNPTAEALNAGKVEELSKYNMIIVGFQDSYGEKDLNNAYGAVEYLQYYTMAGKSILYTHDLTSMYNLPAQSSGGSAFTTRVFGSTANTMLRDLMGMNRYKAVSIQLNDTVNTGRTGLLQEAIAYQNNQIANGIGYDTFDTSVYGETTHGFTYWAMRHFGWTDNYGTSVGSQYLSDRMPFKSMIYDPESGDTVIQAKSSSNSSKNAWYDHFETSGFNNSNEITTKAVQMNEGQITVYPYKIDEELTIAGTHSQTYQLNLEDPEVTVWYCLADDGTRRTTDDVDGSSGSPLTYAASPKDAANNYYIYSKGNIFYSGVGHSEIDDDAEAKLFVNTMIAAYRTAYEAAAVEIKNPGVIEISASEYTLQIPREYDNSTNPTNTNQYEMETFSDSDMEKVIFSPINYNFVNRMDCRIFYSGSEGVYVDKVYSVDTNAEIPKNASNYFVGLEHNKDYYFYYPKKYLDSGYRKILFEVIYSGEQEPGKTTLNMTVQPLFQLD